MGRVIIYPLSDKQIKETCVTFRRRLFHFNLNHARRDGWMSRKEAILYVKSALRLLRLLESKKYDAAYRYYNQSVLSNFGYPMPYKLCRYLE